MVRSRDSEADQSKHLEQSFQETAVFQREQLGVQPEQHDAAIEKFKEVVRKDAVKVKDTVIRLEQIAHALSEHSEAKPLIDQEGGKPLLEQIQLLSKQAEDASFITQQMSGEVESRLQKIEQLSMQSSADVTKLAGLTEEAGTLVASMKAHAESAAAFARAVQGVYKTYGEMRAQEAGLKSLEDARWEANKKGYAAEVLQRKWLGFGKKFNKDEISQLRQEQQHLAEISGLQSHLDALYSATWVSSVVDSEMNARNLVDEVASKVLERLDVLVGEYTETGKSPEVFSPQELDVMRTEFARRFLEDQRASDPSYNGRDLFDEQIMAKAVSVLERGLKLDRTGFNNAIHPWNDATSDLKSDYDSLPSRVQSLVEWQAVQTGQETGEQPFQMLGKFLEQYEAAQRAAAVNREFSGLLAMLGHVESELGQSLAARVHGNVRNKVWQMERVLDQSADREFIKKFDIAYWNICRTNPAVIQRFGHERVEQVDMMILDSVKDQLLQERSHSDDAVKLGYKLYAYQRLDIVPIAVLNAFREPGYSGEMPFVSVHRSPEQSILYKYVESLDTDTLKAVEALNIPGLMEAVEIIRDNPKKFRDVYVSGPDNRFIDNPVRQGLDQALLKMSIHFLKSSDHAMDFYLMDYLEDFHGDISQAQEFMVKILESNADTKTKNAVVTCANNRIWRGDNSLLPVLLGVYDQLEADQRQILQNDPDRLVTGVLRMQEVPDGILTGLGKAIGLSKEDAAAVLALLKETSDPDRSLTNNLHKDNLKHAVRLGHNSEARGLLVDLRPHGYHLYLDNIEYILQLTEIRKSVVELLGMGLPFDIYKVDTYKWLTGNLETMRNVHAKRGKDGVVQFYEFLSERTVWIYLREHPEQAAATVQFLEQAQDELSGKYDLGNLKKIIGSSLEYMLRVAPERRMQYAEIILKVDNSPSQEVQRIKEELAELLLQTEDPVAAYGKIESIFIQNNLPMVGKVYKIFEILFPSKGLQERLSQGRTSPVLNSQHSRQRYYTIYKDLLKCHIESGNQSLRDYAAVLFEGQQYIDKAEALGWGQLSADEKEKLGYVLRRFNTLLANSSAGVRNEQESAALSGTLEEQFARLREALGATDGQKVSDRVAEMYLKPAGVNNLRELLQTMNKAKAAAHDRNLKAVQAAVDGKLQIAPGDMLKGIDIIHLDKILENGSVAKEFLGASSDQDLTPLDTDVARVQPEDMADGFTGALRKSVAGNFTVGGLMFCIRDRGQFQVTESGSPVKPEPGKYELFHTGVWGDQHYGIRTGFPSTEIDYMIARKELAEVPQQLENVLFEIAQHDVYIPVVNDEGTIIFTPEMYSQYRNVFAGLDRFGSRHLRIERTNETQMQYADIQNLKSEVAESSRTVEHLGQALRGSVTDSLKEIGVTVKSQYDTSIIGAELVDTGSTGRHTNLPKGFDFDYSLKLDAQDIKRIKEIAGQLVNQFKYEQNNSHEGQEPGYYQIRLQGVTAINGMQLEQPIDVDIGLSSKAELKRFETQDALKEKLQYIRLRDGQDAYEDALANIVLAKKTMKAAKAYKKGETREGEGGLGGVGVENWILANNGNMKKAFETFLAAAKTEAGERVPLAEFKNRYKILDAGINIKFKKHDNFVRMLSENGYHKMIDAIEEYQAKHIAAA